MARDPFVEEYQKGMAAVRKSRPKKRKLSLGKAAEKRDTFRDELSVEKYQQERNPQKQGSGSLKAGYDPMTDRAIRAIGSALGNPGLERNLRFVDENLIGGAAAENAAFNVGRGEGTGWDALDLAVAAPLAGAMAKPVGMAARGAKAVARPATEALGNLAARVGASRPAQYLREARPLVDNADDAIQTAFTVTPGAQRRITNRRVTPRGLPAPEQRLGLPAPGPRLPEWAAKPRGGQWWPADKGPFPLMNPAEAVKDRVYLSERFSGDPRDKAFAEWFDKALPRYLQNDFATPDDPLRGLADQGYIPGVQNAMQWSGLAKKDVVPFPMQKLLFDEKGEAIRNESLAAMPWLNKLPQTDTIYGVWPREGTNDVYQHVRDEMRNALRAEELGIPADLAVRPESLARMSFPQAVERVGRINQWRAKQAEQAKLSALNSPALSVFKEYPDDPRGLRWVELRAPENWQDQPIPEGWEEAAPELWRVPGATGAEGSPKYSHMDPRLQPLQEALKYEGDVMGHCVGGYCDDVLQGRSRIFSLRDAKGEPHVTIETAPRRVPQSEGLAYRLPDEVYDTVYEQSGGHPPTADRLAAEWFAANPQPDDIVQIKGKQNLAPKEDYLPFVQDFVKGGQWGEIGDLPNTGLTKLPDGRLLTPAQIAEALSGLDTSHPRVAADVRWLTSGRIGPEDGVWEHYLSPYLDGYARGGRVQSLAVKPCSCDKSLAVR